MPRRHSSKFSRSSEKMTTISPKTPTATTTEETIANNSQGDEDASKVFMQLSSAEMQLFKADMDASRAEASMARAEAPILCLGGMAMNQLGTAKRVQIIAALVEGNSINATCRMLGVGKHTVLRLLEDAGCACAAYHDAMVRGLSVTRAQCDEVWSFVFAKQKNVTAEQMEQGAGDCWTWTAIDADTKLIISYMLGDRGAGTAKAFMQDVASRIDNRIQLTTDGHRVYAEAVEQAFGSEIDYAMLVKI